MFNYSIILGCDVVGMVEAVVPGSTAASQFCVGNRVLGCTANNGFQDYVTLENKLMTKILDNMVYRNAVVFGLCSATSAMFLLEKDYLHLGYPKIGAPKKGQSVLVRGGGSAVGSNAIQLTTAAGYDVTTTCSKKDFDYVKGLGAVSAFAYKDIEVTTKVAAELDQGECAGIFGCWFKAWQRRGIRDCVKIQAERTKAPCFHLLCTKLTQILLA
jgi:NADPH:quinone reductase-like Zn-dependent oxidoreductase